MARYGQPYKDRVVARLLPPESLAPDVVSREVGVGVETLERWRSQALATAAGEQLGSGSQRWTAAARLEAVITTAAWMRRPVRLVPRAGSVSGRTGRLEARRDRRPGRTARPQRCGHTAGPAADQRTRARAASQGQGAGRNGRLARALKKLPAIFHKGEDA